MKFRSALIRLSAFFFVVAAHAQLPTKKEAKSSLIPPKTGIPAAEPVRQSPEALAFPRKNPEATSQLQPPSANSSLTPPPTKPAVSELKPVAPPKPEPLVAVPPPAKIPPLPPPPSKPAPALKPEPKPVAETAPPPKTPSLPPSPKKPEPVAEKAMALKEPANIPKPPATQKKEPERIAKVASVPQAPPVLLPDKQDSKKPASLEIPPPKIAEKPILFAKATVPLQDLPINPAPIPPPVLPEKSNVQQIVSDNHQRIPEPTAVLHFQPPNPPPQIAAPAQVDQIAPPVPASTILAKPRISHPGIADPDAEALAAEVAAIVAEDALEKSRQPASAKAPRPLIMKLPSERYIAEATRRLQSLPMEERPLAFQAMIQKYRVMRDSERESMRKR